MKLKGKPLKVTAKVPTLSQEWEDWLQKVFAEGKKKRKIKKRYI